MWFKKKKKVESKPDFSKYKICINGKVMCAYESITGKPFLKISTEDDIRYLFYCSLVFSNNEFRTMTFDVFSVLIDDKDVLKWMADEYMKINSFIIQFRSDVGFEDEGGEDGKSDEKAFYMLDAISALIVKMGIDPHYVMYDMDEWEMSYYYRIMRDMDRERLTEDRLWTYFTILPHVGKKLSSPEKMFQFDWEKNENKVQKELEQNAAAAFKFLSANNTKEEDDGRILDDNRQQGLPKDNGTA